MAVYNFHSRVMLQITMISLREHTEESAHYPSPFLKYENQTCLKFIDMSLQNSQQDKLKIVPQDSGYLYFQKFFPEVLSYQYFFDEFLGPG